MDCYLLENRNRFLGESLSERDENRYSDEPGL